jgi:type II secretory pathway pseudopilin PulG
MRETKALGNCKRASTLIGLLVFIAIIGILGGALLSLALGRTKHRAKVIDPRGCVCHE